MTISKNSGGRAPMLATVVASAVPSHVDFAKIGILSCGVSKGIGEILALRQSLICQFKPDGPWDHCRDTSYHGRLPNGQWQ